MVPDETRNIIILLLVLSPVFLSIIDFLFGIFIVGIIGYLTLIIISLYLLWDNSYNFSIPYKKKTE